MTYIRADGAADINLLKRQEEEYNEDYYQYHIPVTCTMTRYPGEICLFLQIYSGTPSFPTIAKTGECLLQVTASSCVDDHITDRNLSLIYQMQKHMEEKIESTEEKLGERIDETNAALEEGLAQKADNVIFYEEDGTLQLLCGEQPIGDRILIKAKTEGVFVVGAVINENYELILSMSDGTTRNLGVTGSRGSAVYVPHLDARKILTFTVEEAPTEIPAPVDLNPWDEWSSMDSDVHSEFIWEEM